MNEKIMRRLSLAVILLLLSAAWFAATLGLWGWALADVMCGGWLAYVWGRGLEWDEWRGAGFPTIRIKRLIHVGGYHMDLHKIVTADADYCYHTHPANAIRVILWGGYVEEVRRYGGGGYPVAGDYRRWTPGKIGRVTPEFTHRIHRVISPGGGWSLWIRGPVTHEIELTGVGWLTHCDRCGVNRSHGEVYYSQGRKRCRGCHQSLETQMAADLADERSGV